MTDLGVKEPLLLSPRIPNTFDPHPKGGSVEFPPRVRSSSLAAILSAIVKLSDGKTLAMEPFKFGTTVREKTLTLDEEKPSCR